MKSPKHVDITGYPLPDARPELDATLSDLKRHLCRLRSDALNIWVKRRSQYCAKLVNNSTQIRLTFGSELKAKRTVQVAKRRILS